MRFSRLLPLLVLIAFALCLPACLSPGEPGGSSSDSLGFVDTTATRIPYTTNLKVMLGDEIKGYLVRYDPVPPQEKVKRSNPTGTVVVQDTKLQTRGFVSPRGTAYRVEEGATSGRIFSDPLKTSDDLAQLVALILELPESPKLLALSSE